MISTPSVSEWMRRWESERAKLTVSSSRILVDALIEHTRREAAGDWDAVLSTLTDDALYRTIGYGVEGVVPATKHEVLAHYEKLERAIPGYFAGLEMDQERFLVGEQCIAYDGRVYLRARPDQLPVLGVEAPGEAPAQEDVLVSWRMAVVISFRGELIALKDTYSGHPRLELAS